MKKLLDLFCGAGGTAMGYYKAGFEDIVGIDIKPQPNYPFKFICDNAMNYLIEHGHKFDIIHASPPCQGYTNLRYLAKARNNKYSDDYPLLIGPLQDIFDKLGKPFVIENVAGARHHLRNTIMLCGKFFDLKVYRHRWFECKPVLQSPMHTSHKDSTPSAGHGVSPKGFISIAGNGGVSGMTNVTILEYWSMAMNINWMTRKELSQAIPPAYTEWIGKQLIKFI